MPDFVVQLSSMRCVVQGIAVFEQIGGKAECNLMARFPGDVIVDAVYLPIRSYVKI